MNAITNLSASQLARAIRQRALSPIDVVEAHIARIEAVNPALNAVVIPTFETARQQAHQAAEAVASGAPLGPLHGVPFTVKDGFDVAGVRSTCGLVMRAGHISTEESPLVTRLRAAGGILLGLTNVPDGGCDSETENLLFGFTSNPWNVLHSAGGSSGGEAAIIAASGSPLGLGWDMGGSIRLPAHFTGIVGLKPTRRALTVEHLWPRLEGRLQDLAVPGPMARRVEDTALMWDVLRGAEPQPLDLADLQGAPMAWWYSDGTLPSSGAVRGAVDAAVAALKAAGMVPTPGAPAARRLAGLGWVGSIYAAERQALARSFGNGDELSLLAELARALAGKARFSRGLLLTWMFIHANSVQANLLGLDGAHWGDQLCEQLTRLVGERGVAVCPIFPLSAPRLGWSVRWLPVTTLSHFTTWVNLAGLPGLTVPIGFSGNGLPVGVQLVGAPGAERALLTAGLAIQQAVRPVWRGPVC